MSNKKSKGIVMVVLWITLIVGFCVVGGIGFSILRMARAEGAFERASHAHDETLPKRFGLPLHAELEKLNLHVEPYLENSQGRVDELLASGEGFRLGVHGHLALGGAYVLGNSAPRSKRYTHVVIEPINPPEGAFMLALREWAAIPLQDFQTRHKAVHQKAGLSRSVDLLVLPNTSELRPDDDWVDHFMEAAENAQARHPHIVTYEGGKLTYIRPFIAATERDALDVAIVIELLLELNRTLLRDASIKD